MTHYVWMEDEMEYFLLQLIKGKIISHLTATHYDLHASHHLMETSAYHIIEILEISLLFYKKL